MREKGADENMSKQIQVGGVAIGGGAPVSIQSMCNTPTQDAVSYTHLTLPTI